MTPKEHTTAELCEQLDEDDRKWWDALPNPDRKCSGHAYRPENLDLMTTERRWAITHELWLRSMGTHKIERTLDVEDEEPVEVLSYITAPATRRGSGRTWSGSNCQSGTASCAASRRPITRASTETGERSPAGMVSRSPRRPGLT